jgi:hypothetical protein
MPPRRRKPDDDPPESIYKTVSSTSSVSTPLYDDPPESIYNPVSSTPANSGLFSAPSSPVPSRKNTVGSLFVDNTVAVVPAETQATKKQSDEKQQQPIDVGRILQQIEIPHPKLELPREHLSDVIRSGLWATNAYAIFLYIRSFNHETLTYGSEHQTAEKTMTYLEYALQIPGFAVLFESPDQSVIHSMVQWSVVIYAHYWHMQGHSQFLTEKMRPVLIAMVEAITARANVAFIKESLTPINLLKFGAPCFAALASIHYTNMCTTAANFMSAILRWEQRLGGTFNTKMSLISARRRTESDLARGLCYAGINDDSKKDFDSTIKPLFIEYAKVNPNILLRTRKSVERVINRVLSHIPPSVAPIPVVGDMVLTQLNYLVTDALQSSAYNDKYTIKNLQDYGALGNNDLELYNAFPEELTKNNYTYVNNSLMFKNEIGEILPIQDRNGMLRTPVDYTNFNAGMIMAVILDKIANPSNDDAKVTLAIWGTEDYESITTTAKDLGQHVADRIKLFPHLKPICTEMFELDSVNIKYIHVFIVITGMCYALKGPAKIVKDTIKVAARAVNKACTADMVNAIVNSQYTAFLFICASIPGVILESYVGQVLSKASLTVQYGALFSCLTQLCSATYFTHIADYFNLNERELASLFFTWDDVATNYYATLMIIVAAFTIHVITACLEYIYIILQKQHGMLLAIPPILALTHYVATRTMLSDSLVVSHNATDVAVIPSHARFTVRKFRSKTTQFIRHAHFPRTTTL